MGCKQSKEKEVTEEGAAAAAEEGAAANGDPKMLVIFAPNGMQGSSVLKAVQKDSTFKIRAVVGDPESEEAKGLSEMENVEVIKGDLDDKESLKTALDGAYAAFVATDSYEIDDQEKEIQQGKNVVDVAKEVGLKYLVYSGARSEEGKPCRLLDAKATVEAYIKEQEVPHTAVHLALVHYESLLGEGKPIQNQDGAYILDIPLGDQPLAMICCEAIGECIHQILLKEDEYKGKVVQLASEQLKVDEYAAILTKGLTDKKVEAGTLTIEELSKKDTKFAADISAMYEAMIAGKYEFETDTARSLNSDIPSFESWVESNKEAIEKAWE